AHLTGSVVGGVNVIGGFGVSRDLSLNDMAYPIHYLSRAEAHALASANQLGGSNRRRWSRIVVADRRTAGVRIGCQSRPIEWIVVRVRSKLTVLVLQPSQLPTVIIVGKALAVHNAIRRGIYDRSQQCVSVTCRPIDCRTRVIAGRVAV